MYATIHEQQLNHQAAIRSCNSHAQLASIFWSQTYTVQDYSPYAAVRLLLSLSLPHFFSTTGINIVIRRYLHEKTTADLQKQPNTCRTHRITMYMFVIFINIQLIESERRSTTRRSQHEMSATRDDSYDERILWRGYENYEQIILFYIDSTWLLFKSHGYREMEIEQQRTQKKTLFIHPFVHILKQFMSCLYVWWPSTCLPGMRADAFLSSSSSLHLVLSSLANDKPHVVLPVRTNGMVIKFVGDFCVVRRTNKKKRRPWRIQ